MCVCVCVCVCVHFYKRIKMHLITRFRLMNPHLLLDVNSVCCLRHVYCIIVHFKRLGSRCFYDLFERFYFFLFESLCIQQVTTTRHLGIIFSKF